jgi:hypothetical protein
VGTASLAAFAVGVFLWVCRKVKHKSGGGAIGLCACGGFGVDLEFGVCLLFSWFVLVLVFWFFWPFLELLVVY